MKSKSKVGFGSFKSAKSYADSVWFDEAYPVRHIVKNGDSYAVVSHKHSNRCLYCKELDEDFEKGIFGRNIGRRFYVSGPFDEK